MPKSFRKWLLSSGYIDFRYKGFKNKKIDLNTPDAERRLPLSRAIEQGSIRSIRRLLAAGASPNNLNRDERFFIERMTQVPKKKLRINWFELRCYFSTLYPAYAFHIKLGVCFGLAQSSRRAFLSGKHILFIDRLKNFSTFREILHREWEKLYEEVRVKWKESMTAVECARQEALWREQGIHIPNAIIERLYPEKDFEVLFRRLHDKVVPQMLAKNPIQFYEVRAFCEELLLYQLPNPFFRHLFAPDVSTFQWGLPAEILLNNPGMSDKQEYLVPLEVQFSGIYTDDAVYILFEYLKGVLSKSKHKITIFFETVNHVFAVHYSNGQFIYVDLRNLERIDWIYSSIKIAKIIVNNYSGPRIFNIKFFVPPHLAPHQIDKTTLNLRRLNNIPAWNRIHTLPDEDQFLHNGQIYRILFIAAFGGNAEMVQRIVSRLRGYPCEINKQDFGRTAMYVAAHNNHLSVVKVLIAALKDHANQVNLPSNCDGITPLVIAAKLGNTEIVEALAAAIDYDLEQITQSISGCGSALFCATLNNKVKTVKALLQLVENNPKVLNPREDGVTPLHAAASQGNTDLVALFLQVLGRDYNLINHMADTETTPLYEAIYMGHDDCAQLIIRALEDYPWVLSRSCFKGATPLALAQAKGRISLIPLLEITMRHELVAQILPLFKPYQENNKQHCKRQNHWYPLTPADRNQLINPIITALKDYVKSGKRELVLQLLDKELEEYTGGYLQRIFKEIRPFFIEELSEKQVTIKASQAPLPSLA